MYNIGEMKEIKVTSSQLKDLLSGQKEALLKVRENCRFARMYFDYLDFSSNVGGGIPVYYEVQCPFGQKNDIVKIKHEEIYFKIERIRFDVDAYKWRLSLSPADKPS